MYTNRKLPGKKNNTPDNSALINLPQKFDHNIDEIIYVVSSDAIESGNFKDINDFFGEMTEIGSAENRMTIEFNTKVYLFRKPKSDFNDFWKGQISGYKN